MTPRAPLYSLIAGACLCAALGAEVAHAKEPKRARVGSAKALKPQADAVTTKDAQRRAFRTSFPLYDRVALGASTHLVAHQTSPALFGSQLTAHWDMSASLDFSEESIWWLLRHRVLQTQWHLTNARGPSALETVALRGHYLRHDASAFITIPTLGDLRIPADFDIAVEWTLGEVKVNQGPDGWSLAQAQVAQLDLMLDWIRDPSYRHRFATGLYADYALEGRRADGSWDTQLSPLSKLSVLYGWDHARGLVSVFARGACGWDRRLSPAASERAWLPSCQARARAEWTPLSISNAPVSLALRARAHVPFYDESEPSVEATLGLRVGLNLD